MAKSSALKKLKTQKGTKESKTKVAPKKKAKKEAVVKEVVNEIPTEKEILLMKTADLNFEHGRLPEAIEGWADMDRTEKRKALVSVHCEDDDIEEEEQDEESADLDEELDEEADDTVVPIKKAPKKKAKSKKVKPSADDVLANAVNAIENLNEDQADKEVHHLKEDIEFNYFRLGGVLAIMKENKFIGEYKSFREKVEAEFGMKYRKAEYLINIYNNIIESEVEWTSLKDIGWSKLSLISHLLTPDNVDEWVEKANSMNWSSLQAEVKEMKASGTKSISKTRKSDITRMTFQVHEDQRETIEAALEKAKEESETDVSTVALEAICLEYLAGGKKKTTIKEPTVAQFFKQLVKKSDGDVEVALGALLEGEEFKKVFGVAIDEIDFEGEDEDI